MSEKKLVVVYNGQRCLQTFVLQLTVCDVCVIHVRNTCGPYVGMVMYALIIKADKQNSRRNRMKSNLNDYSFFLFTLSTTTCVWHLPGLKIQNAAIPSTVPTMLINAMNRKAVRLILPLDFGSKAAVPVKIAIT